MSLGKTLSQARRILQRHSICDWCLGRQFAMQGYGLTNKDRGQALKTLLLMSGTETYEKNAKPIIKYYKKKGKLKKVDATDTLKYTEEDIKKIINM